MFLYLKILFKKMLPREVANNFLTAIDGREDTHIWEGGP